MFISLESCAPAPSAPNSKVKYWVTNSIWSSDSVPPIPQSWSATTWRGNHTCWGKVVFNFVNTKKGLLHTNTHTLFTKKTVSQKCASTSIATQSIFFYCILATRFPSSRPLVGPSPAAIGTFNPHTEPFRPRVGVGGRVGATRPPSLEWFHAGGSQPFFHPYHLSSVEPSIWKTLPPHVPHTCEAPSTCRSHPHSHTCDTTFVIQTTQMATANKHTSTITMQLPITMRIINFTMEIPKVLGSDNWS